MSRAKTGGIKGGLGLAEDTSDAAISCQQVGPIELSDCIKNGKAQGEVVFKKRTSLLLSRYRSCAFMMLNATRSLSGLLRQSCRRFAENAISAVPVMPWRQ
ncbi:CreA family protein [Escherichia coli]